MSSADCSWYAGGAYQRGTRSARRIGDWLCLAAAPTFALMALATFICGQGQSHLLCSAMDHTPPLNGMTPMYLLMSAFHTAPWLKLISAGRASQQD